MSITIGHLFPSWLTLYGDNGNVKALSFYLGKAGIDNTVEIIEDLRNADLDKFDFLYIGSGRECGLEYAVQQFTENKEALLKYIESGKTLLITGNAVKAGAELGLYEMFAGKELNDFFVSDVSATLDDSFVKSEISDGSSDLGGEIRGFQNTRYLIKENDSPVFNFVSGHGNSDTKPSAHADSTDKGCVEGFAYKNMIATSVIGPLIAINENFRNLIIDRIKK